MIKSVLKLLLILCVGTLIIYAYQTKGHVDIRWQGVSISMKIGTFLFLVLLGTWVLFYIFSFVKYLGQLSKNLKDYWRNRHQAEGNKYVEEAISALAGGMQEVALKKSQKGSEVLKDSLLAKWVCALATKEAGAVLDNRLLSPIISSKNLGLAGYRLRIEQLLKQRDQQAVITETQMALERYPNAEWLLMTLLEGFIRTREFNKALEVGKKLRQLGQSDADSKMVLCYLLLSKEESDFTKKHKYLQHAFELEKTNPIVGLELSRLYLANSNPKRVRAVIEEVWKYSHHPDLGDIYLETLKEMNSEDTLSGALKLLEISNSSLEGYIVVIKACIKCEFYQKARYYLEKAIQAHGGMSYKLFELRVELTNKDGAEKLDYYTWIKQVARHKYFEGWECAACSTRLSQWEHECSTCGVVNSCYWQGEHEHENNFLAIKGA